MAAAGSRSTWEASQCRVASNAPDSRGAILRLPVALLRFHQPMAEHGPDACAQPIGVALPAGHCHFSSSSE